MATNLFLPEKKEIEIEHSLGSAGTYTWIAPDKNRDGSSYTIKIAVYGGGGGASVDANINQNQMGGAGGFVTGELQVDAGGSYELVVASGGGTGGNNSNGGTGGSSVINYLSSEIVRATGGAGGLGSSSLANTQQDWIMNTSGTFSVSNGTIFTVRDNQIVTRRGFNGNSEFGIYYGGIVKNLKGAEISGNIRVGGSSTGGVGGNFVNGSSNGSQGRIVLRYTLKENINDNVPA